MRGRRPDKVEHGGKVQWHRNHDGTVLDFSANINPYPPVIPWNPDPATLKDYPDDRYERLKEAIAGVFNRRPEEITVGNGSVELIRTFCSAVLEPGDGVSIEMPTFGEYEMAAALAGAATVADVRDAKARFVCNPNNPTGRLLTRKEVFSALESASASGSFLFLDEAFIELAGPRESVADIRHENLFCMRSLTKSFAVPGIRFGYGFGNPALIEEMEALRLPWTVNAFAETFAIEAFARYHALGESRACIAEERRWLCDRLAEMNLSFMPPSANFVLIRLPMRAKELAARMLEHRILVRDCTSFGLPDSIRIAVRTRPENEQLVEALSLCLH